jgi:flavin reductase (DIM6/NTAB) family NADH-FMN oxidoreductase RutF
MDDAAKKEALRLFTYGLYLVTSGTLDDVAVFTANWLSQVSFDPPLLAVSVQNDAHSLPVIQRTGYFAVSVLDTTQRELAGRLGKTYAKSPDKARELTYLPGATGCPLPQDTLAAVECRVEGQLPAGDSTIVLGRVVEAVVHRQGEALTMRAAGFKHAG